ncbi:MarR family transcriptional regulator [Glaciihabitans arcticus]|uniref:MarR family transcriptional regulator n=1 Tax=Glaciihabitans arcticus TaxID=2668039 RepID=A0A4Q9GXH8_9MICO|nr:MarR family winged helix-turn-helix transcriptional regulator [Glaciihabitans arcticus]TBN57947.1 MarR family transcriptional regulator [Glaciihabitans arcticus]
MSTESEPQLHYRSAVVENITTLLNIWMSPRFQHDIVAERHRAMSGLEIRILWTLSSMGPARTADMAETLDIGAPAVSKAIAKLDASGLITREPSATDQRSHTLHLSAEGRRAAQELYDVGDAMVTEIFTDWDAADVSQLSTLLARFVAESEGYARRIHRDDAH